MGEREENAGLLALIECLASAGMVNYCKMTHRDCP